MNQLAFTVDRESIVDRIVARREAINAQWRRDELPAAYRKTWRERERRKVRLMVDEVLDAVGENQ